MHKNARACKPAPPAGRTGAHLEYEIRRTTELRWLRLSSPSPLRPVRPRTNNVKGNLIAQPSVQGRFIWEELTADDTSSAAAFYSKVLGWHTQAFAADSSYTVFNAARGGVAGASAPRAP